MKEFDLVIIGGGPAGISAAIAAGKKGVKSIALVDRLNYLGGMLTQCFHQGFGLGYFGEEMSGPDFISKLLKENHLPSFPNNAESTVNNTTAQISDSTIEILTNSFVSKIEEDFTVNIINENGLWRPKAKAAIVATGCRERPIGSLEIYGTRPSGVFTAGSVQKMINLFGYTFGKKAVILGSGDVGMIVANHLTETGTEVVALFEKLDHISGLSRNKSLYVDKNNIPIITSSTITELHGNKRLEAVTVCEVNQDGTILPDTERIIECDTLITSVGLIPELEIIRNLNLEFDGDYLPMKRAPQTSIPNLFVCGNANEIHSMVDSVVDEGFLAGEAAANYICGI